MKKKLMVVALAGLFPLGAMAAGENNVGSCGWGSKLFQGQRGMAPQVLAATTNGTSGNQTFAITTGSSGCTQDGLVSSNWKTAMFIDGNKEKLARDMSVGGGETLDALASLIGVPAEDKAAFASLTQKHFGEIFASTNSDKVVAALQNVLASDSRFASITI